MLLAIDLHEDFIDEERVTGASMLALQSSCEHGSKLDAPESYGFVADNDTAFGKKIFNITVAQVESILEPDGITDDIGRETVTLVSIHHRIIDYGQLSCQYPLSVH